MILAVGEALAEFMRPRRGVPLDRPGELVGPFPSGAPAIFASVAARLGAPTALCAVVGEDPFGELIRQRLGADGVDISRLRADPAATTACAFVSYDRQGERTFVFHVADAAAGQLREADLGGLPERTTWLHVSGATLALSSVMAEVVGRAVARVRQAGGRVALDPNVRPETAGEDVRRRVRAVAEVADVLLPSEGELEALGLEGAAAPLVCTTRGRLGARVQWQGRSELVAAPEAREVDPTGAGDTFAAGFAVATLDGAEPVEAARFAVNVAAIAVEHLGGIEAPIEPRRSPT